MKNKLAKIWTITWMTFVIILNIITWTFMWLMILWARLVV